MTSNIGNMGFQEVDPVLKRAMKLLHSSHANSATELRLLLDEAIKQRYGPEKLISNRLTQRQLDDEANFPGRAVTPPPIQPIDEIINLTNSPAKTISDSPDTIIDSDDGLSGGAGVAILSGVGDDDGNLKDFGDLNCCVCGEMVFTATNRLIECSKCGTLYHQECHKPPISDEEASEDHEHSWQCDTCSNKPTTSKTPSFAIIHEEPIPLVSKTKSSVASSRSSTSSNSSSPFYKPEHGTTATSSGSGSGSSKHTHKSSSSSTKSSSSHKEDRPIKLSASIVTPSINVISGGSEKGHSSSSKRSSTHSSKSSSSSSKSSSKHHDSSSSSSSKRRSNK